MHVWKSTIWQPCVGYKHLVNWALHFYWGKILKSMSIQTLFSSQLIRKKENILFYLTIFSQLSFSTLFLTVYGGEYSPPNRQLSLPSNVSVVIFIHFLWLPHMRLANSNRMCKSLQKYEYTANIGLICIVPWGYMQYWIDLYCALRLYGGLNLKRS